MALTADQVIERARLFFPAIPLSSDPSPNGLDLLNEAFSELLFDIEMLSAESDISLTAGTANYSLPTGAVRLWSARYVRSASTGDFRELTPTNQDKLDNDGLDYLRQGSSEPLEYWVLPKSDGTPELWLTPAPPTTTSTYPKVVVRTTLYTALTGSATLPTGLPSYDIFVIALARKWAFLVGDEKLPYIEKLFQEKRAIAHNFRHSVSARVRPTMRPRVSWRPRKV